MTVRARDLRENIKEMGFDRGVVHTLELLLDECAAHRQYLQQLAKIQSDMADRLLELANVGGDLVTRIEAIRRSEEQYEQLKSERVIPNGDQG